MVSSGKRVRDDHPQKILSLAGVIQHSSNIGIAKVALDLGAKKVLSKLQDLGFVKPPMDFFNMPKGLLRNPATIKPIELITTSYGYGMNATMLQILSSYATIGNGGVRMQKISKFSIKDDSCNRISCGRNRAYF